MNPNKKIISEFKNFQLDQTSKKALVTKAIEQVEKDLYAKNVKYEGFLERLSVDSLNWGEFFELARNRYGSDYWLKDSMGGGKKGLVAYLEAVQIDVIKKLFDSKDEKKKTLLIRILFSLEYEIKQITRLIEICRLERHNAVEAAGTEFIELKLFSLAVNNSGTGKGRVISRDATEIYYSGSKVTLQAKAEKDSVFKFWNGDANDSNDIFIVTMDSEKSVTADFEKVNAAEASSFDNFRSNESQMVHTNLNNRKKSTDAFQTSLAMTKLLNRIESLENTLSEVLRRLDGMQINTPWPVKNLAFNQASPSLTLPEVLKWLALQDRISVVELRARLLPLDLLPGAVINEINERALDLCGELALEETGDEIGVEQAIFEKVLANWDADQS